MEYSKIAQELARSKDAVSPIGQLTAVYSDMTVYDAYQIQLAGIGERTKQGRRVVGKKIGLTSKGMQKLLGVNEPDFGYLLDDMLLAQGEPCQRSRLISPKVEGELAFILKETLKGPGINAADVLRSTAGIMPAIEIVDSRVRDWKIKLPDTIADNASSAMFVLGGRMVPVADLDLRLIGMILEKNGELINSGTGAEVWGHPAASVAWLANKLSEYEIALEAGEVILSGAFTAALEAAAGDVFSVSFDGLGTVTLRFV